MMTLLCLPVELRRRHLNLLEGPKISLLVEALSWYQLLNPTCLYFCESSWPSPKEPTSALKEFKGEYMMGPLLIFLTLTFTSAVGDSGTEDPSDILRQAINNAAGINLIPKDTKFEVS